MGIEIRSLSAEDSHAHNILMNHAFGKGRVVEAPAADATPEAKKDTYGVFDNGKIQAALSVAPFIAHWGSNRTLSMGGIAGVATFASARGRGYAEALLKKSLEVQRDSGQTISALNPFSWKFYARHGWEWVGKRYHVKLPLRELPTFPGGKDVVPVTQDNVKELLEPVCTRFARNYRGVFTSETRRWDSTLDHSDGRTTHVYQYPGDGSYLLWRYNDNDGNGEVREFIANSPEGFRALLGLLHYFAPQCEYATLTLPSDTPLWNLFYHWNVDTNARPVFMGRVVDFAAALREIDVPPSVGEGNVTVSVWDEQAVWNSGVWRVTVADGKATASLIVGEASPDVQLDIRALSQAFWGTPSLAEIRTAGQITVSDENAYALLSRLLPAFPVFTLDFF
jgi:GNAT superfamily N-acetyltransferase